MPFCLGSFTINIIAHKYILVNIFARDLKTLLTIYILEVCELNIIDKICTLIKDQGKKQIDLTNYLGVSKNVFTDWKAGRNNSYKKHLPQIAEFLGVSVDYLVGNEEQNDNEKLSFALFGTADVDEEVLNDVRKYAQIARRMREEDKKKED